MWPPRPLNAVSHSIGQRGLAASYKWQVVFIDGKGDCVHRRDATGRVPSARLKHSSIGLSRKEIVRFVNQYIAVSGGYLGDFSYSSHVDFYRDYCGLDISPYDYEGTTRERFIAILSSLPLREQAAVVRGVIDRFPVEEGPATRTAELRNV